MKKVETGVFINYILSGRMIEEFLMNVFVFVFEALYNFYGKDEEEAEILTPLLALFL